MADVDRGYDVTHALDGHPRYMWQQELGRGTFGTVGLCKDLRNKDSLVAIKLIQRGPTTITEYVQSEVLNFRTLLHPHIVQLQEVFLTQHYLGIAMEYANGGDTFDYVVKCRGVREPEARWLFQQLIIAVDYCHQRKIVNRDLKLENTLLHWHEGREWPTIKLCDFGYSKNERTQSRAKSRVGTPGYMAPEVASNRPSEGQTYDGRQADVWSAGVILFIMLFARFPFERPDDSALPWKEKLAKVLGRIKRVDYRFPTSIQVSEECRDLISKILVADPLQRYKIADIVRHPWFATDLPAGALEMNTRFLEAQPVGQGFQTIDSVRAALEEGREDHEELLEEMMQRA